MKSPINAWRSRLVPRAGAAAATSILLVCLTSSRGWSLSVDAATVSTQPANALVLLFDATEGFATYLQVVNTGRASLGTGSEVRAVSTRWSFRGSGGRLLAAVDICLPLDSSILVDPTNVSSLDAGKSQVGPTYDLSGEKGVVVITALAVDDQCAPLASESGSGQFVDDAIYGRFSITNLDSEVASGSDGIGLGTNGAGTATNLPEVSLAPVGSGGFLDVQTDRRDEIRKSRLVYVALQEGKGSVPGELGLVEAPVTASVKFVDSRGDITDVAPLALPGLSIETTAATSASFLAGAESTDEGFVRLTDLSTAGGAVGGDTFVYGIHGQAFDSLGSETFVNGQYATVPADVRDGITALRRSLLKAPDASGSSGDAVARLAQHQGRGQLHRGSPLFREIIDARQAGRGPKR